MISRLLLFAIDVCFVRDQTPKRKKQFINLLVTYRVSRKKCTAVFAYFSGCKHARGLGHNSFKRWDP